MHISHSKDDAFVERIRAKDPQALKELVDVYAKRAIGYITAEFPHLQAEDAKDIVADAIYKAMDSLDTYRREKGSFKTWLFRIAHNTAIDFLYKAKGNQILRNTVYLEDLFPQDDDDEEGLGWEERLRAPSEEHDGFGDMIDIGDLHLSPDDKGLPIREAAEVIQKVLAEEKPKVRAAFEARYQWGWEPKDVIRYLVEQGYYNTPKAAESALLRLRAKLAKAMKDDGRFDHGTTSARTDVKFRGRTDPAPNIEKEDSL